MREILVFLMVFGVLVAILGTVIWLLGGAFDLNLSRSWSLAVVALVFLAPGIANVHVWINRQGNEDSMERSFALIRGIGMIVTGLVCAMPLISNIADRAVFLWGAGIGLLLSFGSMPLEAFLERVRSKNCSD